jgi:C-terminal processing protease CtpA/Prc
MNGSRRSWLGGVLAALMVTTLLTAGAARAQDRDIPLTVKISDINADDANLKGKIVADLDDLVVATIHELADEMLGATLRPVGDTLREQLGIPAGQGLLVAALRGDGPSAQAGLKQNDVLLSLADKPLAAPGDVAKLLKAAGDSVVPLKVLRAGKPLTIPVRPVYRVTLGPAVEQKTEFFIGVSIDPVDDALRAQLGLPAGQGVVVSDVIGGSPAEKAGVHRHDIVLEMGGKPIDSPEGLARQVQATRDQPSALSVLRGGKRVTIPVTPTVRKVEAGPPQEAYRLLLMDQQAALERNLNTVHHVKIGEADLRQRLDHVEKELQALRAALDRIHETLKSDKANKRD